MAKKILFVDDDPVITRLAVTRLKEHGYEVFSASDGKEGIRTAQDEKPDLIILDVFMPDMDGFSFVQETKGNDQLRDIPILILTAQENLQELFKMEGIKDYVLKPFDDEVVVKKIVELIGE